MSKRIRVTPFGYMVILGAVIVLLLFALVIVKCIGCAAEKKAAAAEASEAFDPDDPDASEGPEIIEETPDPFAETDPYTGWDDVAAPTSPVYSDTPLTPSEPTATPEPTELHEPTAEELENAVFAKMTNGGVVLRDAPSTHGNILGKYAKGTELNILGSPTDDYYYVQMIKDGRVGYMAQKFIKTAIATPEPTATPEPVPVPEGAVEGKVIKTKVALRTAPDLNDDSNKVGELLQGAPVFIYYQTGDFYCIEVPGSGKQVFAYHSYIKPNGAVPVKQ